MREVLTYHDVMLWSNITSEFNVKVWTQGPYSLSGKTSYRQILWSLEAAWLDGIMIVSL